MTTFLGSEWKELTTNAMFGLGEQRVCVVTGGARGIGLAISAALVANGARVYAVSRKASSDIADALTAKGPGQCIALACDVASDADCRSVAATLSERGETQVHLLVNNAGAAWGDSFETYPEKAWLKLMGVNVHGVFALTRALRPFLQTGGCAARPAAVVNIGSIDGIRTSPVSHYAYSASKAAVHQLTRKLAFDFAEDGDHITVNAIAAGAFVTDMMKGTVDGIGGEDALAATIPLGRAGKGSDIAGLVLFLASPAGSWMTGSIVTLDGGVLTSPTGKL